MVRICRGIIENKIMIVISKNELKDLIQNAVALGYEKEKESLKSKEVEKEKLLTTRQTLHYLKIDRSTLKRWVDKGRIKKYSYCGKKYYKYEEIIKNLTHENF